MTTEQTHKELDTYDWKIIFEGGAGGNDPYTRNPSNPLTREVLKDVHYTLSDVKRVIATSDGENDGESWLGLFEMNDGRFLSVSAFCDYTGWDCQAGGSSEWTTNEADAIACLTQGDRERLFPNEQTS